VSIVVPTLNEEANMRPLLRTIRKALGDRNYDLLVVDGGSTDGTVEVARTFGARILFDSNGKGAALRTGLGAAEGEVLVAIDADLSQQPRELPAFIRAIEDGYDICMGSRFMPGGKSYDITLVRAVGNRVLCWLVNMRLGTQFTDLCYGYRSFRKGAFERLGLRECGFGIEAELSIAASKHKMRVLEIPSIEKKRKFGEAKLQTFRDGYAVLRTILKNVF
jgi:glycosyltransferase involved in cell wall biosynthesis